MRKNIQGHRTLPPRQTLKRPALYWLAATTLLFAALDVTAQPPPATDIYLVALEDGDSGAKLGAPVNITQRAGYDNQPYFLDGSRLLYTSISDDEQADIWIYDLESRERHRLTETPESEYSPTPIPGEDAISVVRVEADGTQRLWRFPLQGGVPDLLLPKVQPVGYHAWQGSRDLVLFVLGEPHTLQHARRGDGVGKTLAKNIGRALHRIPGSEKVAFVHKESEAKWTIRSIDLASGDATTLHETRPGREDFTWSPSGKLWMGDGSVLYRADPNDSGGWRKMADFEKHELSEITRITVHPQGKWIAFVAKAQRRM